MLRSSMVGAIFFWLAAHAQAAPATGLFEELSRDFGSVPRGQIVSHPFRVINNTSETVVISNVRPSCAVCSSARALHTVLAPGQETAVMVTMNTNRFAGVKTITVYVTFSQPRMEEVRLWVQANSRDDIAFTPDVLNFGTVKRGTIGVASINVTFFGMPDTKILECKCDSNYVQPRVEFVRREGAQVVFKIDGKVRADTPAGKWFTDIWIKTSNPAAPKLRVPVTVEIEASLNVSPHVVALGPVKAGAETERKVILRGVRPFRILNVSGNDSQLHVQPVSSEAKTVHVLTVTLMPMEPGDFNRLIRVQTDLKTGGDIEFNAHAQVLP